MAQPHDLAVVRLRRDFEASRKAVALDGERVVARYLELGRQATEQARAVMAHARHLAVHHALRPHDLAAEDLSDGLVAKANTQDRHASGEPGDQLERNAGAQWIARPGRDDDGFGGE